MMFLHTIACAGALASPNAARLAAQDLCRWLHKCGGTADVVVGPTQYGLGLLAQEDMSAGQVAVSVPAACVLSADATARTPLADLIAKVPTELESACLGLALLAERAKVAASATA